jgi:hypothetical protein
MVDREDRNLHLVQEEKKPLIPMWALYLTWGLLALLGVAVVLFILAIVGLAYQGFRAAWGIG